MSHDKFMQFFVQKYINSNDKVSFFEISEIGMIKQTLEYYPLMCTGTHASSDFAVYEHFTFHFSSIDFLMWQN